MPDRWKTAVLPVKSTVQTHRHLFSNTNQKSYSDYRGKPESLPNTVNKDSKRTLFDNQDPSDFSQKTVESSKKKYTEEETAKALEELSQLFQFI